MPNVVEVRAFWHSRNRSWTFHAGGPARGEEDKTGKYWAPFYAYDGPGVPGTREVRSFWHHKNSSWCHHFGNTARGEEDKTGHYFASFWAFEDQKQGTELVRAFWHQKNSAWCHHFDHAARGEDDKTGRYWPGFYAFRSEGMEKRLQEERDAAEKQREADRRAVECMEKRLQDERKAAEQQRKEDLRRADERMEKLLKAAEQQKEEDVRRADERMEKRLEEAQKEAQKAVAKLLEEERQLERQRVHSEKLKEWRELNRDYPIPKFLESFVTRVLEDIHEDADQDRFINVGVLGDSGVGKSELVEMILEHFRFDGVMPVSGYEGDCSLAPQQYKIDSLGNEFRIWDLPGQGTVRFPAKTYLRDMGLKYFDAVLVVTDGRLSENDAHLLQAVNFAGIWSCAVRTKMDSAVDNGKRRNGHSHEQVLENVRATLTEQLGEKDPNKIHLVTSHKERWDKFGTIDTLCEQIADASRIFHVSPGIQDPPLDWASLHKNMFNGKCNILDVYNPPYNDTDVVKTLDNLVREFCNVTDPSEYIFLSHSTRDASKTAFDACSVALTSRNIAVFNPVRQFMFEKATIEAMERKASGSFVLVACLSPEFFRSKYCFAEVAAAAGKADIIPVVAGGVYADALQKKWLAGDYLAK